MLAPRGQQSWPPPCTFHIALMSNNDTLRDTERYLREIKTPWNEPCHTTLI